MGVFNQSINLITKETICEAFYNLVHNNLEKFEYSGNDMYVLHIDDERVNCLIDPNESVQEFEIYFNKSGQRELNYMWLMACPTDYDHENIITFNDYNLSYFTEQDLITIYQSVKDALNLNKK